jgi:hypothetical protein
MGFIQFEKVRHLDGPSFFALRRASILAGCSAHYPVSQLELWTDARLDASLHEPLPDHFYFAKIENVIAASGMFFHSPRGVSIECVPMTKPSG